MNPLNYASLEASKRLVGAGIVLETDLCRDIACNPNKIITWPTGVDEGHLDFFPAPSMAEVWRKMPTGRTLYSLFDGSEYFFWYTNSSGTEAVCNNTNPADALIDLLIWVRGVEKRPVERIEICRKKIS